MQHLISYLFTPYPVDCCTIAVSFFLTYCNACNLLAASGQLIFPRGIIKVSIYLSIYLAENSRFTIYKLGVKSKLSQELK